jgi:hypothetical protein
MASSWARAVGITGRKRSRSMVIRICSASGAGFPGREQVWVTFDAALAAVTAPGPVQVLAEKTPSRCMCR